jgi:hypothetical protein
MSVACCMCVRFMKILVSKTVDRTVQRTYSKNGSCNNGWWENGLD